MEFINVKWLAFLLIPAAWTIFFSFFSNPGLRGFRNLGWISCYVLGAATFFVIPWKSALANWLIVGVMSGLVYFLYATWHYMRSREGDERPKLGTLLHGLFLWPIMLPEVIEYSLTDMHVLKTQPSKAGEGDP